MPAASTASLRELPTLEFWIEAAASASIELAMTDEDEMNQRRRLGGRVKRVVCGVENGVHRRSGDGPLCHASPGMERRRVTGAVLVCILFVRSSFREGAGWLGPHVCMSGAQSEDKNSDGWE